MHRLWFERGLPSHLSGLVIDRAEVIEPGPPGDPLVTAAAADGAIASSLLDYDAAAFDQMPRLRVVSRTGIGSDRVDIAEATLRGIGVCVAPDAPTVSTAEHTVALILAVAKRLDAAAAMLRTGASDYFTRHSGVDLAGRTLGVVGYGRIGRRVASMGRCLGMEVIAFDPAVEPNGSDVMVAGTLDELLATSDVVTLHVPLADETRHLMNERTFASMRPGAILVNTARGGLVDQEALLAALESGRLLGAGLDVTDPEPLPPSHPLLGREDVIVTPHIASATVEGKDRLYEHAIGNALAVLDGFAPAGLLNPEVLDPASGAGLGGDP
jgi:phosphoglycerate dehydrogenase-like enzyme